MPRPMDGDRPSKPVYVGSNPTRGAKWAVIELGFLAALQAVVEGFDSLTVHQQINALMSR